MMFHDLKLPLVSVVRNISIFWFMVFLFPKVWRLKRCGPPSVPRSMRILGRATSPWRVSAEGNGGNAILYEQVEHIWV